MILMQRGMRGKIGELFDPAQEIVLQLQTDGQAVYDDSCFGIDSAGKLSDDRYMIFYNQAESPEQAICYAETVHGTEFRIRLSALPMTIDKLVFTVSIDGAGTMQEIRSHLLTVSQNGTEQLRLSVQGTDFHAERAIVLFEIYRKDEWRYAAVASGFDGGLADLLRFFGGEEVTEQAETVSEPAAMTPEPTPAPTAAIPEPVSVPTAEKIAANTKVPVSAADTAPPAAALPQYEEAPAETALPEPKAAVSAPAASQGAAYRFPDPIRIPPPVIPPPVITPPVIPVPQCRTAEPRPVLAEREEIAEMQPNEEPTINE